MSYHVRCRALNRPPGSDCPAGASRRPQGVDPRLPDCFLFRGLKSCTCCMLTSPVFPPASTMITLCSPRSSVDACASAEPQDAGCGAPLPVRCSAARPFGLAALEKRGDSLLHVGPADTVRIACAVASQPLRSCSSNCAAMAASVARTDTGDEAHICSATAIAPASA